MVRERLATPCLVEHDQTKVCERNGAHPGLQDQNLLNYKKKECA